MERTLAVQDYASTEGKRALEGEAGPAEKRTRPDDESTEEDDDEIEITKIVKSDTSENSVLRKIKISTTYETDKTAFYFENVDKFNLIKGDEINSGSYGQIYQADTTSTNEQDKDIAEQIVIKTLDIDKEEAERIHKTLLRASGISCDIIEFAAYYDSELMYIAMPKVEAPMVESSIHWRSNDSEKKQLREVNREVVNWLLTKVSKCIEDGDLVATDLKLANIGYYKNGAGYNFRLIDVDGLFTMEYEYPMFSFSSYFFRTCRAEIGKLQSLYTLFCTCLQARYSVTTMGITFHSSAFENLIDNEDAMLQFYATRISKMISLGLTLKRDLNQANKSFASTTTAYADAEKKLDALFLNSNGFFVRVMSSMTWNYDVLNENPDLKMNMLSEEKHIILSPRKPCEIKEGTIKNLKLHVMVDRNLM